MSVRLVPAGTQAGGELFTAYAAPRPAARACGEGAPGPTSGDGITGFYEYDPRAADCAAARAAAVDREYRGDRQRLARALAESAVRLGGGPDSGRAAARLADGRSLAVVTGQQAGLLTGPLYTISKALGAVALAREIEARLGRPVVPVFWAATEDHDLAEANQAWIEDREGSWRVVRCELPGYVGGQSVGAVRLDERGVAAVAGELRSILPPGLWGPEAVALVLGTGRRARTLGEWFCRLVQALLGPLGVVVFDPMEQPLRQLAAPGVERVISASEGLSSALQAGEDRVRHRGYSPQVVVRPGDVQLFMYPDGPQGPRRALRRAAGGDGFIAAGDGRTYTARELAATLARSPELFSGNVVTRPLLQDTVLPTVAYVAGPSEVAYYGQYREAYAALGMTMPVIWPRPGLTVVRPAIARLLSRHRLRPGEIPGGLEGRREAVLRENDPVGVEDLFSGLRKTVDAGYAAVTPRLGTMDDTLGRLAEENRRRVQANVAWLERKARQVLRRRSADALRQLARIESALWPRRGPQERTANVVGFLGRCSPDWISELGLGKLQVGPPFVHQYVYLE